MNMATVPYTMHPHGVKYSQANEGVYFKFSKGPGSSVKPMDTFVYKVLFGLLTLTNCDKLSLERAILSNVICA